MSDDFSTLKYSITSDINSEFINLIKTNLYFELFEKGLISHTEFIMLKENLNTLKGR